MRADIRDQNHRPLGYIDYPDNRPIGPVHPLVALAYLIIAIAFLVVLVMAANEPGPGEPGYCYDEVVVGHTSLGLPQFACVDEVPSP